MNNAAIEKFCIWARGELIAAVSQRAAMYGIRPDTPIEADAIEGKVLSASEKAARNFLMKRLRDEGGDEQGLAAVIEQGAYTWFNRLAALRYMEVNGRLPSRVRVFSASDGEFAPQILSEALNVNITGLDRARLLELLAAGDDEATFRYLLLAQCHELADCLPDMFGGEDAWELLLPEGLLRNGGVIQRLVDNIDEDDWREGVQIVGWMYQYYNAERKREVFDGFKKGKKAERLDIAPATQLFTPDWIVRYLVENSLGRLWIRSHPSSSLKSKMAYYIEDDGNQKDAPSISSPEDITLVDPACGSAHMLVYAFDILFEMYSEAGYVPREAARLIIEKNLTGIEIDQRAAALASFALSMKACEGDSRFLTRDVSPRIHCLSRIALDESELSLAPSMAARHKLVDAMAHLDECGSLFVPQLGDIVAIEADFSALEGSLDLFADAVRDKLSAMKDACELFSRQFDVVVANPPYMGGKNMNSWLSAWVKKEYPDVKGDLFSCFVKRCSEFGNSHAQIGMMTPYVWMFIGTYEKLRQYLIDQKTITSLVQLEYSGFAGATVPICAFTFENDCAPSYRGGFVRLSDFVGADNQAPKTLEAIANPDCGWFYRRASEDFKAIPGSPIAYWASDAMRRAFESDKNVADIGRFSKGIVLGRNDNFIRKWWEVPACLIETNPKKHTMNKLIIKYWYQYNKGGSFRKWYGNIDTVIEWKDDGKHILEEAKQGKYHAQLYDSKLMFNKGITWTGITSGKTAFRICDDVLCDQAGLTLYPANINDVIVYLAFLNSTVKDQYLSFLTPTLNITITDLQKIPLLQFFNNSNLITEIGKDNVFIAKADWNSFETAIDFGKHPLV